MLLILDERRLFTFAPVEGTAGIQCPPRSISRHKPRKANGRAPPCSRSPHGTGSSSSRCRQRRRRAAALSAPIWVAGIGTPACGEPVAFLQRGLHICENDKRGIRHPSHRREARRDSSAVGGRKGRLRRINIFLSISSKNLSGFFSPPQSVKRIDLAGCRLYPAQLWPGPVCTL